jgi:non-heme chloroperoxidase
MVHGAWTDAWCWAETFMPFFSQAGFEVWAVSLRGHGASEGREHIDLWGLADYLNDIDRTAQRIARPLVLFGSSMGGLLLQRWIAAGRPVCAAVTIGSVPPTGLSGPLWQMALTQPHALGEVMRLALSGEPSREFLRLLAHAPMHPSETGFYYRHLSRESSRALWEMSWFPGVLPTVNRCPLLAVHGLYDRMVPAHTAVHLKAWLGADLLCLDNIGHVPMIEREWQRVAKPIAQWLARCDDSLPDGLAPTQH